MIKNLFFIILYLQYFITYAQSGALDLTFNVGSGVNGNVYATAIQVDGKIIIGGIFSAYNGDTLNCLARLNTDGSLDTTFHIGTGANWSVYFCVIQSDGKILIGGRFSAFNGISRGGIARINTDGSVDTTFNPGTGVDNMVEAVALQADGKIVIGGVFASYNGVAQNNIARLNTDGSLDSTFNSAGTGANGSVQCIGIQSNGAIVIGGDFTSYNSNLIYRVARLNTDGTQDAGFTAIPGANKVVYSIAIQTDGHIVIGGAFTQFDLQNRRGVARLDLNSVLDDVLNSDPGADQQVDAVLTEPNGQILITGKFANYNDTARSHIALLTDSGYINPAFDPGTGPNYDVLCAALQTDGKIIIGGMFTTCDGIPRNGIARLYNCTLLQPGPISGDSTTLCGGTSMYSITPVAEADNYTWNLPVGWTGSSDSTSIAATSNGIGGVVSVSAYNDLCGYSLPQTDTIVQIEAPQIPICLVTVDSQSTHNNIIWKQPHTTLIDSIFIYREVTLGVFNKIAALPFDSGGEYQDYGANPNATSYSYEISILDTCGVESPLSLYHTTVHLQYLGGGNLSWTLYDIENSPNPVISFNIYKDAYSNGNFVAIGLVPGNNTTFTDVNYADFPDASYLVDVNWSIFCGDYTAVNTTRSNIRPASGTSGIGSAVGPDDGPSISLYPNPADKIVTIHFSTAENLKSVQLYNSLGQSVLEKKYDDNTPAKTSEILSFETLASGVYSVYIETSDTRTVRKLILH